MSAPPRLTRNQSLVLEALTRSPEPLSAYAILDRLRAEGMRAPLQVYRALDRLLERGLVHRLDTLKAFVACRHQHGPGENHDHGSAVLAFGICTRCARVSEFHDSSLQAVLDGWARREGFRAERSSIEITGLCATCAAAEA
ncbi:Fur family transcriptional regulator [Aurantimonas sp. Leaf443]|uniref:Fur family transcriptional regulator n=1 Tax=Aurantimonas sp. Leaf443 TaxID=1736378 RepID=UPI0006F70149|nr:Fur family transcriptional regulator [Aurantimonas sp. Leaf443]KQT85141.1 Fur family transcriptional regulator [Aurantimonas sp. Leaf443]